LVGRGLLTPLPRRVSYDAAVLQGVPDEYCTQPPTDTAPMPPPTDDAQTTLATFSDGAAPDAGDDVEAELEDVHERLDILRDVVDQLASTVTALAETVDAPPETDAQPPGDTDTDAARDPTQPTQRMYQ
jgi:hypothetical protein